MDNCWSLFLILFLSLLSLLSRTRVMSLHFFNCIFLSPFFLTYLTLLVVYSFICRSKSLASHTVYVYVVFFYILLLSHLIISLFFSFLFSLFRTFWCHRLKKTFTTFSYIHKNMHTTAFLVTF